MSLETLRRDPAKMFTRRRQVADNNCRDNLIAAAIPLFAAKGFNGVSVREVAAASGANLSMISYYFGSKEGLYAAVLTEQFAILGKIG